VGVLEGGPRRVRDEGEQTDLGEDWLQPPTIAAQRAHGDVRTGAVRRDGRGID
jgi:hypothetical protein